MMKLILSFAARDRLFGKAMRRVLPAFDSLSTEFAQTKLHDPIHDSILVALTDDLEPSYFEETPNNRGNFQVLMGVPRVTSDGELKLAVFERVKRAVVACPFSTPDKANFERLFQWWADANVAS
jgi:hypothetical protein